MNTLIAGLLALATLGGSAALVADCTDLAGQATVCNDSTVDPAGGVIDVDVAVDLHPTPPVAAVLAASAEPTCQDVAGQATVCHDVVADPASGVNADVTADVHPTPPA